MPASCPSCHRPVALSRAECLYCGGALPATTQAILSAPPATDPSRGKERSLVIVDLGRAEAAAVAVGLGLSRFEASQRVNRGGPDLWRIAPTATAQEEAERLRAAGLKVLLIPEGEVREGRRPVVAAGGRWIEGSLDLRVDEGSVRVSGKEILLIVQGPIAREYPPSPETRRVRLATLEPGYRIHLHRGENPRPLELDPDVFDFGPTGVAQSSLLALREWVQTLGLKTLVDDSFRRILPALAPGTARDSLGAVLAAQSPAARDRKGNAVPLDNVGQFRFYSAWRGAVERRRTGGT